MEEKVYVLVYTHSHSEDSYYEDDFGHECHTLDGKTVVKFKKVKGWKAMQKACEDLGEANADNPPYDEYRLVMVYEDDTNEVVPKSLWYPDGDEE